MTIATETLPAATEATATGFTPALAENLTASS